MKINSPLVWNTVGLLGTAFFRNWIDTIDFKWALYDPEIDPALVQSQRFLLLFWHEHILTPLFMRRNSDVTMLLSQHGDAEIVGQIAKLLGMKCVRGSSFRGGPAAVKQLLEQENHHILAITPDGPRGPYRKMAQGPVFLASKLQLPIVLAGVGFDRPWRAKSWDRFVVPRLFSRGRIITSPKLVIPPKMNKQQMEHFRLKIETLLTQLTTMAEHWALSGKPIRGESMICSGPKCSLSYYGVNHQAEIDLKNFDPALLGKIPDE